MESKRVRRETKYIVGPSNPDSRVFWDFPVVNNGTQFNNWFHLMTGDADESKMMEILKTKGITHMSIVSYDMYLGRHMLFRGNEAIKAKVESLKGRTFHIEGVPPEVGEIQIFYDPK